MAEACAAAEGGHGEAARAPTARAARAADFFIARAGEG